MPEFVYTALRDDDAVVRFRLDAATGALTDRAVIDVGDGPSLLALHPHLPVLYVGHRGATAAGSTASAEGAWLGLSSHRLDTATGGLEEVSRVALGVEPGYLATDRTGRWLLTAHYYAGACLVHRTDDDGRIAADPPDHVPCGIGAHYVATDPSNRYAYVPHITHGGKGLLVLDEAERTPLNAILSFRFDAETGEMTPNEPDRLAAGPGVGPRHLAFHPHLEVVHAVNEQGSSVSCLQLDPETGRLVALATTSTLPSPDTDTYAASQLRVHPSGRFVYASNRGYDSVVTFAADAATGALAAVDWVATDASPRAIELDTAGRYLFAAGLDTGRVQTFAIHPDTGALTEVGTVHAGGRPMWVLAVDTGG